MIQIRDEEIQTEYGFTNGCCSCETHDLSKDIKEIIFSSDEYKGTIVLLCKECRELLKSIL